MMSDVSLPHLFDYDDNDIATNRAGRLSARQKARLNAQLKDALAAEAATVLTVPVTLLLIALYFVVVPPLGDRLGSATCIVIGAALFAVVGAGYAWWHAARWLLRRLLERPAFAVWLRQRVKDATRKHALIEQGSVIATEGIITVVSDGEHDHILLNDVELQTSLTAEPDERLWSLMPGSRYIFYTVEGSDWIAAVEKSVERDP